MHEEIRIRWTPIAVDALLDLEESGLPHIAQRMTGEIADRLSRQPGSYREVQIASPGTRRRRTVRRLYLGRELPYLVYFTYNKPEDIVEVVRILHVRQRPVER